ncbi:uncharacterized protein MELLADRAFT_89427 [Melampsora larici-populina 98AG31]|uniref:Protein kinase domain-containing protein n=1 Tax=Melampsora larici-populina (strain 98AG31 / pathotype 3-4-7) TaxID=747676 RepID=F4RTA3_MELLP|nr:uncharacterized protein MELLADRAFT_89427 [Melampsora larici-populina 98AG31]EGG04377.1 hypothetical protein MELLADRAFT_89427 [Melampsora larici-populina 98AG31]
MASYNPKAEQEFELLTKIGSGGFGTVWRARSNIDQSLRAIKVIRCYADEEGKDNADDIIQELRILRQS